MGSRSLFNPGHGHLQLALHLQLLRHHRLVTKPDKKECHLSMGQGSRKIVQHHMAVTNNTTCHGIFWFSQKNKLPNQEYHYEMIYKPQETKVADNLSRYPKSRNLSKKAIQTELFIDNVIANALRPSPNSIFNWHNPKRLKLLIRLRLGLSHLRDHKFKRSFQDSVNPICTALFFLMKGSFS